jgi:hypothetical protein
MLKDPAIRVAIHDDCSANPLAGRSGSGKRCPRGACTVVSLPSRYPAVESAEVPADRSAVQHHRVADGRATSHAL